MYFIDGLGECEIIRGDAVMDMVDVCVCEGRGFGVGMSEGSWAGSDHSSSFRVGVCGVMCVCWGV